MQHGHDDDVIRDPWPHYARLRDLGPVVWLKALGNYVFTQYGTVRDGLRDHVETLRPHIQSVADDIVAACVRKGSFEAITDLAQPLPLTVVRDLIGLPDFVGRDNILKWASAAFDMQGIQNARGQAARPVIAEMKEFITREVRPDTLKPGSWSHRITEMAARAEIDPEIVPFAIRDYINPSLDTTISAIGPFVLHAGSNPGT